MNLTVQQLMECIIDATDVIDIYIDSYESDKVFIGICDKQGAYSVNDHIAVVNPTKLILFLSKYS